MTEEKNNGYFSEKEVQTIESNIILEASSHFNENKYAYTSDTLEDVIQAPVKKFFREIYIFQENSRELPRLLWLLMQ